jgi:HAE1 family hydrophobic/amphiphilic exporter-1
VLVAVFVPVSFFPGTIGILYRQFSLTIAFSIAISAFNALTLSPALSALFLRGEEARTRQLDFLHIRLISRAFTAFIQGADALVTWAASAYARIIHVALQLRYVLLVVFFAGSGLFHGDCAGASGLLAGLHHGPGRSRHRHHCAQSRRERTVCHYGI